MRSSIVIAFSLFTSALAQDAQVSNYRLHFRLQESRVGSARAGTDATRNFVLVVQNRTRGRINASSRIPYYSSSKGEARELHNAALGSIIECTPEDRGDGVRLDCSFESSYVATEQPVKQPQPGFLPVMNSRQVSTTALAPIGPEVQIAGLDDPSSGHRLTIFVSAERFAGPVRAAANE